jgi:hypothetical protein
MIVLVLFHNHITRLWVISCAITATSNVPYFRSLRSVYFTTTSLISARRAFAILTGSLRRLSHQLQNAENRIAQLENRIRELEAEVELYKVKMERAKQWLRTLFSQIEERLFG